MSGRTRWGYWLSGGLPSSISFPSSTFRHCPAPPMMRTTRRGGFSPSECRSPEVAVNRHVSDRQAQLGDSQRLDITWAFSMTSRRNETLNLEWLPWRSATRCSLRQPPVGHHFRREDSPSPRSIHPRKGRVYVRNAQFGRIVTDLAGGMPSGLRSVPSEAWDPQGRGREGRGCAAGGRKACCGEY